MEIPSSVLWEIALIGFGFIFGTLWGHHAAIGKRVTYAECAEKRKSCPCTDKMKELEETMNVLHPHKK